jgi:hypothetical protein
MKLEVPIKVDIDDVTELIHDLQCLQTYKLGADDTMVLVSLDAVADVFADHIKAKRLDKDIDVPSKWIPVSERLPEEGHYVLITKESFKIKGYEQRVIIAKRSADPRSGKIEWWSPEFGALTDEAVLAWMPAPAPYKAESENKE